MKKKMNYLILILTIIFMVGCTNVENAIQEVTKVDKEAEGTITEDIKEPKGEEKVVDEPAVEEMDLCQDSRHRFFPTPPDGGTYVRIRTVY